MSSWEIQYYRGKFRKANLALPRCVLNRMFGSIADFYRLKAQRYTKQLLKNHVTNLDGPLCKWRTATGDKVAVRLNIADRKKQKLPGFIVGDMYSVMEAIVYVHDTEYADFRTERALFNSVYGLNKGMVSPGFLSREYGNELLAIYETASSVLTIYPVPEEAKATREQRMTLHDLCELLTGQVPLHLEVSSR